MGVFSGRYRAEVEGDFVVFVIGMRINKPWQVRRWGPVATAMPPMVKEALADPAVGLLHAEWGLMGTSFTLIQYWRSFEQLDRYARDPQAKHLPAWARYNRKLRGNDAVGVYHETYKVRAGDYEGIYVDMPRLGLGKAGGWIAVGSSTTAAQRIGARGEEDVAPVEA